MLRYGPMQVCICLRSASCWTECPDRCCCCWRPTTCWGASKPPYRPEPPPRPSSTCPAAAYVPWPGQRAHSSPCHSRGLLFSLLVRFVFFLPFILNRSVCIVCQNFELVCTERGRFTYVFLFNLMMFRSSGLFKINVFWDTGHSLVTWSDNHPPTLGWGKKSSCHSIEWKST